VALEEWSTGRFKPFEDEELPMVWVKVQSRADDVCKHLEAFKEKKREGWIEFCQEVHEWVQPGGRMHAEDRQTEYLSEELVFEEYVL